MQEYYNRRAQEYEQIYRRDDPVRAAELTAIASAMCAALAGREVLEVACGTGYWTERLADCACRIVATDASSEMLKIARSKQMPASVSFAQADAFDPGTAGGPFDGGLANFWFSHVPRRRIPEFLHGLHERLTRTNDGREARLFMADNCYQEGIGGELVVIQGSDDTFKRRRLSDGSEHMILKNYYDAGQLAEIFGPFAKEIDVQVGTCYWWVSYVQA
jgi:SAM-dependent methyltransferase